MEKIRLAKKAPDSTIDKKKRWIGHQVEPSLAAIFVASGYNVDVLVDYINGGLEKLSDKQIEAAEEYYMLWKTEQRELLEGKKKIAQKMGIRLGEVKKLNIQNV